MSTAALPQNTLLPQAPGGNAPGAALALLVHAGLIVALTLGVDWRNREPETVSAELWAAVPQMTAPPPVAEVAPSPSPAPPQPPPPAPARPVVREAMTPPAPDIAIEQDRRRKAEAERKRAEQDAEAERKKREKLEAQKLADKLADKQAEKLAQEKANDERLDQQHKDNVRRLMGQAGATPGQTANSDTTGSAARSATPSAAPSASYAGKVKARVRPNIVFTGTVAGDTAAEVEVNAAPGGSIISRRLIKSSGNKDWDETVLRAIDKTRDLPPDTDGRVPATLIIAFNPNE